MSCPICHKRHNYYVRWSCFGGLDYHHFRPCSMQCGNEITRLMESQNERLREGLISMELPAQLQTQA